MTAQGLRSEICDQLLIMDSGVHQAMLGDQEKPKILSDNSSLEPDWLTTKYRSEKKEMWWDSSNKARYDRNYCGCFVNIFYVFILITEIILWIKVIIIHSKTESMWVAVF